MNKNLIKDIVHRIVHVVQKLHDTVKSKHAENKEQGRYVAFFAFTKEILADGFALWLVMLPVAYCTGFWKIANPLLIIPYGFILGFIFTFKERWKQI